MALTAKKRLFAQAIIKGLSNRDAAIHAGYSEKSASTKGAMLAKDPDVIAYIEQCQKLEKSASSNGKKVQVVQAEKIDNVAHEKSNSEFVGRGEIPVGSIEDPLEYLKSIWTSEFVDDELRMKAAIAGLPYVHGKVAAKGKKETKADEAKQATKSGKFGTLSSQLPS